MVRSVNPMAKTSPAVYILFEEVMEGGNEMVLNNDPALVKMESAIVEFLDEHDDPSYANGSHLGARRIHPTSSSRKMEGADNPPPHYAIVTPLPSKLYAR